MKSLVQLLDLQWELGSSVPSCLVHGILIPTKGPLHRNVWTVCPSWRSQDWNSDKDGRPPGQQEDSQQMPEKTRWDALKCILLFVRRVLVRYQFAFVPTHDVAPRRKTIKDISTKLKKGKERLSSSKVSPLKNWEVDRGGPFDCMPHVTHMRHMRNASMPYTARKVYARTCWVRFFSEQNRNQTWRLDDNKKIYQPSLRPFGPSVWFCFWSRTPLHVIWWLFSNLGSWMVHSLIRTLRFNSFVTPMLWTCSRPATLQWLNSVEMGLPDRRLWVTSCNPFVSFPLERGLFEPGNSGSFARRLVEFTETKLMRQNETWDYRLQTNTMKQHSATL